MAPSNRKV